MALYFGDGQGGSHKVDSLVFADGQGNAKKVENLYYADGKGNATRVFSSFVPTGTVLWQAKGNVPGTTIPGQAITSDARQNPNLNTAASKIRFSVDISRIKNGIELHFVSQYAALSMGDSSPQNPGETDQVYPTSPTGPAYTIPEIIKIPISKLSSVFTFYAQEYLANDRIAVENNVFHFSYQSNNPAIDAVSADGILLGLGETVAGYAGIAYYAYMQSIIAY